jgi:CubicO group peptidase (beta-lactamase class C family)
MKQLGVPGVSVVVIDDGRIAWAKGYGVREAGRPDPVTPDTLFQAASISKPLAAAAALRLVREGKLSLDGDVNESLKAWKIPDSPFLAIDKVTLRRLLSHTAGFGDRFGFPGYAPGAALPTLPQILDGLPPAVTAPKAVRLDAKPGERFRYSGGGYCIVQLLIEETSAQPFARHMREKVLGPLGMERSTYEQPLPPSLAPHAATGHRAGLRRLLLGEKVKGGWRVYPEQAAAGLWTTPTDLARFAIAVQRAHAGSPESVLSKASVEEMLTPQVGGWGLGLSLGGRGESALFRHGGSNEGFKCVLFAFKETGRGAVIMTNSDNGGTLGTELLQSIAAEYKWPKLNP